MCVSPVCVEEILRDIPCSALQSNILAQSHITVEWKALSVTCQRDRLTVPQGSLVEPGDYRLTFQHKLTSISHVFAGTMVPSSTWCDDNNIMANRNHHHHHRHWDSFVLRTIIRIQFLLCAAKEQNNCSYAVLSQLIQPVPSHPILRHQRTTTRRAVVRCICIELLVIIKVNDNCDLFCLLRLLQAQSRETRRANYITGNCYVLQLGQ